MKESASAGQVPSDPDNLGTSGKLSVKVLFVDDDEDYAAAMMPVLSRHFEEVVYATSGREAWKKLSAGSFGLAILDVLMEEPASGLKLCRRIRSDAKLEGMPVLVLSAVDERFGFGLKERLGREGFLPADDFLDKSRSPDEIAARARALCGRSRQSR